MPLIMIYFIRQRRDLIFSKLVLLIALFIVACGTTHLLSIITIWIPIYWLESLTKAFTALVSVITAVSMLYIIPKALRLPRSEDLQREVTQRIIAEKALRESNHKLNTILDSIPAHVLVKDIDYNYQYINKAVEDYFGIDKESIIGHSSDELFYDESTRIKIREQDRLVFETGQPTEYEIIDQKQQHTFLTYKYPLINETNATYALCVIALDISRLKDLTQQLQEKELMWKFAIEGAGDGVWDWNMETDDLFYSRIWKGMLGYTQDELMDNIQTWQNLLHSEDKATAFETLKAYLEGHTPFYVNEFRMRCKDGSYKWVLARGMVITQDVDGKPLRMIGTHSDISIRKQSENQLILSDTALNTINQGVLISDSEQNIIWANKAYEELTGYNLQEILGKNCRFLQGGASELETKKEIHEALAKKQPFFGELLNYRKDGTPFWNELAILPIFNKNHELTNFMSVSRDMSLVRQTEASLRQGQIDAQQANLAKSQFLAMMSHEIRTPLNAILGMQELLLNSSLNEQQSEYINTATEAGVQLLHLVNDILDLTKVESGKLELEILTFDAVVLVEDCTKLMAIKAQEKNLEIHTVILGNVNTWIKGDPLRFRQVLLNLLGNAIKFTESGSITVKLSPQSTLDDDCALLLEVIDTGIGIEADVQSKLFEIFTQADPSDTRKYGGSGLGLAISKRLVELWGGHIGLDSTPNVGSRFWFSVGLATLAPAIQSTAALSQENKDLQKHSQFIANVLIVEDSLLNQTVMTTMLRNAGHQVDVADCGARAIEAVSNKNYDIILMDVSMPDMSGMEATAIIRQLGGTATSVPIIGITAHALTGYEAMCLAAGMNGYATKPISQQDLLALVASWCVKPKKHVTEALSTLEEDDLVLTTDKQSINIDEAKFDELTAILGQQQVKELLQMYQAELNARCASIKQAIISKDLTILSREGHTIKSSSANFGFASLQALGKELETCGYNDDLAMALIVAEKILPCAESTIKWMALRC
jgi:PAS domain S-box-containing protein